MNDKLPMLNALAEEQKIHDRAEARKERIRCLARRYWNGDIVRLVQEAGADAEKINDLVDAIAYSKTWGFWWWNFAHPAWEPWD